MLQHLHRLPQFTVLNHPRPPPDPAAHSCTQAISSLLAPAYVNIPTDKGKHSVLLRLCAESTHEPGVLFNPMLAALSFPNHNLKTQETLIEANSINYHLLAESSLDTCVSKLITNVRLSAMINCSVKQ
jgi:hypothetical protein